MIERLVPKDILKHKSKVFGGLTTRQLVCFAISIGIGLAVWFWLAKALPLGKLKICLVAIPSIIPLLFGFITIQGQPLEKVGMEIIRDNFIIPPTRLKEIHYPNMEKEKKKNTVTEANGNVRKLNCDKNGKIVVKRSSSVKTIR